jgi:hypothetical protein
VTVTARADELPVNGLNLSAELVAWAAADPRPPARQTASLEQVGPGLYRGSLPCPPEAPAAVAIGNESNPALWLGGGSSRPTRWRRFCG